MERQWEVLPMAVRDDEHAARAERARAIGLFRYQLIREAADPELSMKARGRMVREIAGREHADPFGRRVRISRDTLDRWIRAWRRDGFDALVPSARQSSPRLPTEIIDVALALKKENPERTAAQVRRILRTQLGWAPGERTLQRYFAERGLIGQQASGSPAVFGRFEASLPNQLWTGDAAHALRVAGHKTFLFAFLDDHSRLVVGHRFGYAEDTVRLAAALRPALGSRGVPDRLYVDNGSSFVDSWLLRACAVLGIKLTHSTPGRPEGRGKIERFFKTVREQFLVEITGEHEPGRHHVGDLLELNRLFTAWVETVYHRRVHSETGQAPLERWLAAAPFSLPTPDALAEAFRWEARRTVRKTATVSLHGNIYQVDPALVGRVVELVFDPFDLTRLDVRFQGESWGLAVPHRIDRHSHPKARPETPPEPPTPTGIDYARLLDDAHQAQLAQGINYTALANGHVPGQLDLLTGTEAFPANEQHAGGHR
jgi:putative transposase